MTGIGDDKNKNASDHDRDAVGAISADAKFERCMERLAVIRRRRKKVRVIYNRIQVMSYCLEFPVVVVHCNFYKWNIFLLLVNQAQNHFTNKLIPNAAPVRCIRSWYGIMYCCQVRRRRFLLYSSKASVINQVDPKLLDFYSIWKEYR